MSLLWSTTNGKPLEIVKQKLLEAADINCRKRQKVCKEKQLNVGDRVFIRRIQKKGESKLIPRWKGPYRILERKSPNVYRIKCVTSGKTTDQHIENIKSSVIARESEIPLDECPNARLPFQEEEPEESVKPVTRRRSPRINEGSEHDNWIDDTFWLDPNMVHKQKIPKSRSKKVATRKG